ncbi:hypothetical protein CGCF415_v014638 [Colletotrichum fructicola]|uniref:Uncharacterized protein n=1 Tax=Colletotrichum fructicola (strain Nara gc5) TaxID=1213859 RepID=L2FCP5_COLFN|nr:hypothetical protein CGCF415_v014638 [Colletotrichum fructicola]KAF4897695.1 hypothetical protein CGCFRS4_v004808 [Colletotrichum fructicola]
MQDIPVIDYRNEDLQKKIREDCIEGLVMPITGQTRRSRPRAPTLERFRGDLANDWQLAGFNVHEPAEFFALCKERYRELSWIGPGPSEMSVIRNMNWEYESEPGSDSDPEDDFSHNKMARKMKKAGWPGYGEERDWDRKRFERLLDQGNDAHPVWHDQYECTISVTLQMCEIFQSMSKLYVYCYSRLESSSDPFQSSQ